MTENRDDFEHRLGQGLKRWAEAGEPTLDLEAAVMARPRRPWLRWVSVSVAAALLLVVGGTFTFPAWAGRAAAWPFIGPVIQEMIMKDAGLKWAYDAGLMQGTLAEASHGGVTVRILAVVADRALTTILYQITGLPEEKPGDGKPIQATRRGLLESLARPVSHEPELRVKRFPSKDGFFVGHAMPMRTPMGIYGTLTMNPVAGEGGTIEIEARVKGETLSLSFPVSRSMADRLTEQTPAKQSMTFDGITYTIDSVIQTPAQTVVRYTVTKPEFTGGYSWSNHEFSLRLERGGQMIDSTQNFGQDGMRHAVFPRTELPARLTLQADVKAKTAEVVWPLVNDNVQTVEGVPVTLKEWEISGDRLAVRFEFPRQSSLVSFGEFELVDAKGKAHPLKEGTSGWSSSENRPHDVIREFTLPSEAVTPAAIRATRIAVPVQGPWVFELQAP